MKRKGCPHVAKQTHEVFYPTTSSSKKQEGKIGYSETKPKRRELVSGIPRMPTQKGHAQSPAYQAVKYKVEKIHLGLASDDSHVPPTIRSRVQFTAAS